MKSPRMSNSIASVELDQKSLNATLNAFKKFGKDSEKVIKDVVDAVAINMSTDAKVKLKTDGHIVTGRLWSSVHPEYKPNVTYNYKDDEDESFDGSLKENFGALEAIVGTNVTYAGKIEFMYDSFLRWAAEKQRPLFLKRMNEALNNLIGGYKS